MGLRDISGVFSREFIVGYFAPAFFIAVVLAYSLDWIPERFHEAGGSDQILLVGGAALLVAMVLNGLQHPITSIYSGTRPVDVMGLGDAAIEFGTKHRRPTRRVAGWMKKRLQQQFDDLQRVIDADPAEARTAYKIRDSRLGSDREGLTSTRLGSARSAVLAYANDRWGLDFWYAWPRIEPLVTDAERTLRRDAETDQAFFLNGALLVLVTGSLLAIDECVGETTLVRLILLFLGTVGLHWILYRFAVQAAERAGTHTRASIDLHYPELLSKLGAQGDVATASSELDRFWLDGTRPAWLAELPHRK